jgi:hypothetical protein
VIWRDNRNGADDVFMNVLCAAQPYGTGLAGSGGIRPRLTVTGHPILGAPFRVAIDSGRGGAAASLWFTFGRGDASIPVLGGTVLVAPPHITLPLGLGGPLGVPGQGSLSFTTALGPDPSLHGLRLNLQAFVADPAAPYGVAMTGAVEVWFG